MLDKLCAKRVEMDIAGHFEEIGLSINKIAIETPLIQMPNTMVPTVEVAGVGGT